jgi:class 3 adenylate cyclase/tetratricopeptide (TPR) repeat protein
MRCSACGGDTPEGKRFCKDCGAALSDRCVSCGAELLAGARFCADCGTAVGPAVPAPRPSPAPPVEGRGLAGGTELRHVSVLFCDIVGFTPFAESKDPADVREFLSGYFEVARAVIGRYGGVIEKYIGDAVMAVWGAPVANEDDAERAVRAGLDLISAVEAFGAESDVQLAARVGIVTGRAATATGSAEALVVGDRVNTAARIQAAAQPGSCYVDETTRAATSAAIAYADRGLHELKGKVDAVHLFEAQRVVAAVAGSQRSVGIEAPFTGREHELRLLKELFHASVDRSSARLALVSGVAGIGKSRLAWELFKYVDGLTQDTLWHAGRCLSYGDGVSYWALSEMVRARLQISEEDPTEIVAERLRAGLERWIPSPEDRSFIEPRLGQLLGLDPGTVFVREELFAGWRLFFERLAEYLPVTMVFEDMQWADRGLVDFVDQLMDWSANHPLFLVVLTRPEGTEREGLVVSRRNVTTVSLEPLTDEAIGDLLDGLVEGLPRDARHRIVERAEGIPLYAVETVRALVDRGVIASTGDGLKVVGEIGALDILPELTALISSRLDALGPIERQLVKECAVLGDSFPRRAVEAVTDLDPATIEELLGVLVRREILTVRTDKLSPERGQYAFSQSLIRSVAYEMLTADERKARHVRTALHLAQVFADEGAEVAEVIASHYHDAYRAAIGDADAEDFRRRAEEAAVAAGERADAVGGEEGAERAFLRAAELSDDPLRSAEHLVRAATMAAEREAHEHAEQYGRRALAVFAAAGDPVGSAKASVPIWRGLWGQRRFNESMDILLDARAGIEGADAPPAVLANLHLGMGISYLFTGRRDEAWKELEMAALLGQHHELLEPLGMAMHFKAGLLRAADRTEEARLYFEGSLDIARHKLPRREGLMENNIAWFFTLSDIPGAEEHVRAALAIARRRAARQEEVTLVDTLVVVLMAEGRFSEAEQAIKEVLTAGEGNRDPVLYARLACLHAYCGRPDESREALAHCQTIAGEEVVQIRVIHSLATAHTEWAAGRNEIALEQAQTAVRTSLDDEGVSCDGVRHGLGTMVDAAVALGRPQAASDIVEEIGSRPTGTVPPFVRAHVARCRALIDAASGGARDIEGLLRQAVQGFEDLGSSYWRARALLDLAEWLVSVGRGDEAAEPALSAGEGFALVGAAPLQAKAEVIAAGAESIQRVDVLTSP